MLRTVVCAFLVVMAGLLLARPARACGCVDWPAERRMAEAAHVFIGRTPIKIDENDSGQNVHFTVLEVLKGEPAAKIDIPKVYDDCERSFGRGELALVFVVKGHLPVCGGNVDLEKLMPTLGEYMGGDQQPSLDALKLALSGRVHGSKMSVYAPTLAGRSLQVGSTKVSFVNKKGEELLDVGGTTHGSLTWVVLRTPEAIADYFLIGRENGRLAVLEKLHRDLKIK
jgi:hypothetical protein